MSGGQYPGKVERQKDETGDHKSVTLTGHATMRDNLSLWSGRQALHPV